MAAVTAKAAVTVAAVTVAAMAVPAMIAVSVAAIGMAIMGMAILGMAAVRMVVSGHAMVPQKSRSPAPRRRASSGSSGRPSTVLWSPATDSNRWIPGPSSW